MLKNQSTLETLDYPATKTTHRGERATGCFGVNNLDVNILIQVHPSLE